MTALRIWDFRRGDDDDNRTSPFGGGLRRILLSAALEFNYVKAAIAFFDICDLPEATDQTAHVQVV